MEFSPFLNTALEWMTSPAFGTVKIAAVAYVGLLWLSLIIWVTRDSMARSKSFLFQAFSIVLNIGLPGLGALLYLVIRPGKTQTEKNLESMEEKLFAGKPAQGENGRCPFCGHNAERQKVTLKPASRVRLKKVQNL